MCNFYEVETSDPEWVGAPHREEAEQKMKNSRSRLRAWLTTAVLPVLAIAAVSGCKNRGAAANRDNPVPPLGKQDGPNYADTECLLTLRSTKVSEDGTKLIGLVDYDAAELESGSKPGVTFTTKIGSLDPGDFQQICRRDEKPDEGTCIGNAFLEPADGDAGSLEGFVRLQFELPLDGAEAVEIIPWMDQSSGGGERGRAWDHNRPENDDPGSFRPNTRPGPFNDNYFAVGPNFSIPLDEDTCPKGGGCKLPGVKIARAYENVPLRDPTQIKWEPNVNEPRVFVSEKLGSIVAFPDNEREAFSGRPVRAQGVRRAGPAGRRGLRVPRLGRRDLQARRTVRRRRAGLGGRLPRLRVPPAVAGRAVRVRDVQQRDR